MFKIDDYTGRNKWDDKSVSGLSGPFEGNEGWYLDKDGKRYVMIYGSWYSKDLTSKYGGYADIWASVNVLPKLRFGSVVQRGYSWYADLAIEALKKSDVLKTDLPIVMCGHSLGGATAVLTAIALKKEGFNIENVVVYGPTNLIIHKLFDFKFKKMFPNAIHYITGKEFTQFFNLINLLFVGVAFLVALPLGFFVENALLWQLSFAGLVGLTTWRGTPIKPTRIKVKHKGLIKNLQAFIDDHQPWLIENLIPAPWEK